MEETVTTEAVRERLIIAGIRELEEHGLNDFSLRRVALACEVSCAAPYRHFKSKEDLILEIIRYINRQWSLLQEQIRQAFRNDERRCLIELAVAGIRFWIANPNFRSVLLLDDPEPDSVRRAERNHIHDGIQSLLSEYCAKRNLSPDVAKTVSYSVRTQIYGTVLLLGNGELENTPETMRLIRERLNREIPV